MDTKNDFVDGNAYFKESFLPIIFLFLVLVGVNVYVKRIDVEGMQYLDEVKQYLLTVWAALGLQVALIVIAFKFQRKLEHLYGRKPNDWYTTAGSISGVIAFVINSVCIRKGSYGVLAKIMLWVLGILGAVDLSVKVTDLVEGTFIYMEAL